MIWPVGRDQIKATWHYIDQSGNNAAGSSIRRDDAHMLALGYVHNLSKRTALYGTLVYIQNKGGAGFGITGGAPGARAGSDTHSYEFGLRQVF